MNPPRPKSFFNYNDSYSTCHSTDAALCIYLPDGSDPTKLSAQLDIQPSRTQVKGEIRNGKVKQWPTAWFLESKGNVQSKDIRRHIDWLLDQLESKSDIIRQLQMAGAEVLISCFWVSAFGHGGPMLDADILKRLAVLNLGVEFDIYFDDSDPDEN